MFKRLLLILLAISLPLISANVTAFADSCYCPECVSDTAWRICAKFAYMNVDELHYSPGSQSSMKHTVNSEQEFRLYRLVGRECLVCGNVYTYELSIAKPGRSIGTPCAL